MQRADDSGGGTMAPQRADRHPPGEHRCGPRAPAREAGSGTGGGRRRGLPERCPQGLRGAELTASARPGREDPGAPRDWRGAADQARGTGRGYLGGARSGGGAYASGRGYGRGGGTWAGLGLERGLSAWGGVPGRGSVWGGV